MNYLQTFQLISQYSTNQTIEGEFKIQIIDLLQKYPNDFYKSSLEVGHLTGSAWLVSPDYSQVLLTHHRKLAKWLQPGGHCEEADENIFATSWREAHEETGIQSLQRTSETIFDIDIHLIPARGTMPAHNHFDIRFLIVADPNEPFNISEESNDLRWFALESVAELTDNESIRRMVKKTQLLRSENISFV
jgi:8-oxo-dGTP pyrophosphatase MutT (NUDIX family)